MIFSWNELFSLLLAVGSGLFIGIERERNAFKEKVLSLFSLRSFVFFALGGWLASYFGLLYGPIAMAATALTLTAVAMIGAFVNRESYPSLTSELAALFCIGIGLLSRAEPYTAVVMAILVILGLTLKENLQEFALGLKKEEYLAAIKFIIVSAIMLPLLPSQAIDPWGVFIPREFWLMVVLISAISFAGYIFTRILDSKKSILLSGIVGGLVSSTAVALTLAGDSKKNSANHLLLAMTALAANSMMYMRIIIWTVIIFPSLLPHMVLPFLGMLIVSGMILYSAYQKSPSNIEENKAVELENPMELLPSIKFALSFIVIVIVTTWIQNLFGEKGLLFTALLASLSDVDAISLQFLRLGRDGQVLQDIAAAGLMIAGIGNTLVKGVIGSLVGSKEFSLAIWKGIGLMSIVGATIFFVLKLI